MMTILDKKMDNGHYKKLTMEEPGRFRVQIWNEDASDWDWLETPEYEIAKEVYDELTRLEDFHD